jgi:hypothetical protein
MMERLGLSTEDIEQYAPVLEYDLYNEPLLLPTGVDTWNDYFKERGVSPEVIREYRVQWKNDSPQGAILPIYNVMHKRVGVVVRYRNPKESGTRYKFFGGTTPVWPMDKLPLQSEKIVVTEGVWSAMRLTTFWGTMTYSLMGAKGNMRIVEATRPYAATFLYDRDQAGMNACKKMRGFGVQHAYCLPVSPDDMTELQLEELTEKLRRLE